MQITVTITGLSDVVAKNQSLAEKLQDFTTAMIETGKELTSYFGDAPFVTEGLVFGDIWTSLKRSTIKAKQRHAASSVTGISTGAAQELVDTGTMRDSFRYKATPRSVYIDNSVDYWKYHQTGVGGKGAIPVPPDHPGRGNNLPQRMTLGINAPVEQMIMSIIGGAVSEKIESVYGS